MADLDRHACCRVLELRQYALRPGGREALASLFEHHFLDALAETGMHVPGLFADLDDPDRLVWLRGFTDMASRHRALGDFYLRGEVWREHGPAANATMIDSDDVLLLSLAYAGDGYPVPSESRLDKADDASLAGRPVGGGLVVDVMPWSRLESWGVTPETLVDHVLGAARVEDTEVLLVAATHPEPNDFDGLPVRDEKVAVWLARYPGEEARERVRSRLGTTPDGEQARLGPLAGSQIA